MLGRQTMAAVPRGGESDALGAQVGWVWSAFEVVEAFELAEQVVEGLSADA